MSANHCSRCLYSELFWSAFSRIRTDTFLRIQKSTVEKHCLVEWNVKLRVEIKFKTFYLFLEFFCTDSVLNILLTRMVLLEIFAYPSNERVIYGPELNL